MDVHCSSYPSLRSNNTHGCDRSSSSSATTNPATLSIEAIIGSHVHHLLLQSIEIEEFQVFVLLTTFRKPLLLSPVLPAARLSLQHADA